MQTMIDKLSIVFPYHFKMYNYKNVMTLNLNLNVLNVVGSFSMKLPSAASVPRNSTRVALARLIICDR